MSYPKQLDDYDEQDLQAELTRREGYRLSGLCDYCQRPFDSEPACKYPERHTGKPKDRVTDHRANPQVMWTEEQLQAMVNAALMMTVVQQPDNIWRIPTADLMLVASQGRGLAMAFSDDESELVITVNQEH